VFAGKIFRANGALIQSVKAGKNATTTFGTHYLLERKGAQRFFQTSALWFLEWSSNSKKSQCRGRTIEKSRR
jgi:hypothetical protein